jgi:hypothetical protein
LDRADELEQYLREATILDAYSFTEGGGHGGKQVLILEGGVGVLAKPGGDENQHLMARREVAAWEIIKALGWADLMGATVLRMLHELGNDEREGSLQVLWPNAEPDSPVDGYDRQDVLRAASFDAIIQHTDRNGHNWLSVPRAATGASKLKLVDHGYALDMPGQPQAVQSTFFESCKDEELPDEIVDAIEGLLGNWPPGPVQELLDDDARQAASERATRIVRDRQLAPGQE